MKLNGWKRILKAVDMNHPSSCLSLPETEVLQTECIHINIMSFEHTLKAVRGSFLDITRTVKHPEEIASALRFIEDGLMLLRGGRIEWFGE